MLTIKKVTKYVMMFLFIVTGLVTGVGADALAATPSITYTIYSQNGQGYTGSDGAEVVIPMDQTESSNFSNGLAMYMVNDTGISGELKYQVHCHDTGWSRIKQRGDMASGWTSADYMLSTSSPWIEAVTIFIQGELSNYYYVDYAVQEAVLSNAFYTQACGGRGPEYYWNDYVRGWAYHNWWVGIRDDSDIIGSGVVPNGYSKGNGYNFAGTWGCWLPIKGIQARIKPYNVTLTINPNGGSYNGSTAQIQGVVESNSSHFIGTPTRDGYVFGGWAVTQTSLSSNALNGNQLPDADRPATWEENGCTLHMGNEDVILTAQWVPWQHAVVYDANGGTGAPGAQTKTAGSVLTLSSQIPQCEGHVFTGWNTRTDGSGTSYAPGGLYGADQNGGVVTLYAQWKPVSYTVHFDGNGATSGSMDDMSMEFGKAYQLSQNRYKREYTVSFNGNGGSSRKESSTASAKMNGWLDYNMYYYKGMWFNHYGFDAPYYVNKYADVNMVFGYNKYHTLDHWYTYVIQQGAENRQSSPWFKIDDYMKYGGTDLQEAFGTDRLSYVAHYMNTGVHEGRTAANPPDTVTSQVYPDKAVVANLGTLDKEKVTLTADWQLGSVTLPEAERTGYVLEGWYTEKNAGTKAGNAGDRYMPTKNVTLYAHWRVADADTYIIHFDGNGADSGKMEDLEAVYDQDIMLPPNQFVRTTQQGESVFTGWSRTPDGSEAEFADQETVRNLAAKKEGRVTLYAIWDDCPQIKAVDRYFSLEYAREGKITEEELLRTASAWDLEDGVLENRTQAQIAESGLYGSLSLYGYAASDFTQLTGEAGISMTYRSVDFSGNVVKKTVMVHIAEEEMPEEVSYIRFINKEYYGKSYENGGLHPNSIWRKDAAYRQALEQALDNLENNTPEITYYFDPTAIQEAKEYIEEHGFGNSRQEGALEGFYERFLR